MSNDLVTPLGGDLRKPDLTVEEITTMMKEHRILAFIYITPKDKPGESTVGFEHPQWLIDSWAMDPVRAIAMVQVLRMHASAIESAHGLNQAKGQGLRH